MAITPRLPDGERVYAIGDVHGRADLLAELLAAIRHDNDVRPTSRVHIVLLGDLIDRGMDSASVVAQCRVLTRRHDRYVVLKGNHEAMMVDALQGSFPALAFWLKHGGDAALASWGVPADVAVEGPSLGLMAAARSCVSPQEVTWLDSLPLTLRQGNCLFVHAGIRPGVALAKQDENDLLWIRHEFTEHTGSHPYVVVHGHTVDETGPCLRDGRLGIDTGAYRTGRLTAVGIEGEQCWSLSTDTHPVARREPPPISESVEAILAYHDEDEVSVPGAAVKTHVLAIATFAVTLLVVGAVAAVRGRSGDMAASPVTVAVVSAPHLSQRETTQDVPANALRPLAPPAMKENVVAARNDVTTIGADASSGVSRVSLPQKAGDLQPASTSGGHRFKPPRSSDPQSMVRRTPAEAPITSERATVAPLTRPVDAMSPGERPIQLLTSQLSSDDSASFARSTPPPTRPPETRTARVKAIDAIRLLRRQ